MGGIPKRLYTLLDYFWQASSHDKQKIKQSVIAKIVEIFTT
jgi:hypothetical protein